MSNPSKVRALIGSALVALAFGWPAMAAEVGSDPKAVKLAEEMLEALGGEESLAATRFLRFEFFGFRLHHLDRQTGHHRLEGKTREGEEYVVLHNINSREGEAWLNGEKLAGEDLAKWLEQAYGAWINDTYWLLMPYKLLDDGVTLKYAGQETLNEVNYDKVELTFAGVGLTPGDRYWAYINPQTKHMDRWAYHLQGWEADKEPTAWDWNGWAKHGDIYLSSERVRASDGVVQTLGKIKVFDHLPEATFTSSAAVAAEH